jgi:hypothetical protein
MFRDAYDRWRDLSGTARIERDELFRDSNLAHNFNDNSIAEAGYIPVPRFQQLLWGVLDGRHASSNRRDNPLPTMKKIDESPPVHVSIITPGGPGSAFLLECRHHGRGISSCLQMARTVPSLISRWRGTLAILCKAGLN